MTARILTEDVRVPMRDGVRLAADVFTVDDGHPRPVLLVRTPYSRAAARAGHDPVALSREGWAVVIQDVRGRWDSAGSFDPFRQELADGADTVAWCADQPWSTGQVAMAGASYDGITQWMAAMAAPPALRAISPTVTTPFVREGWIYEHGALNLGFLANWGIGLGMIGSGPGGAINDDAMRQLDQFSRVVHSDHATDLIAAAFPPFATWLQSGTSPYWTDIDPARLLPRTSVPAYHLTGWFDIFCESSLAAYRALNTGEHAQRLVIGPWTHGEVFGTTAGELDFGMAASGFARFPAEQRAFLRSAVEGREIEGGASIFVMGRNQWLDLPSWPPTSEEISFYLDAGRLTDSPPQSAGISRWHHDPRNPVPTRGGRTLNPGRDIAGPVRQDIGRPHSIASFTGEPLQREFTVIGSARAVIHLQTSAAVTDLTAKLIDVYPDGQAYNILDSVVRLRNVGSHAVSATVELGSTAYAFAAGHRIRLDVASSNFPRFDLTPQADQIIHHGPRAHSRLVLPGFS